MDIPLSPDDVKMGLNAAICEALSNMIGSYRCSCGGEVVPREPMEFSTDLALPLASGHWFARASLRGRCSKCEVPVFLIAATKRTEDGAKLNISKASRDPLWDFGEVRYRDGMLLWVMR